MDCHLKILKYTNGHIVSKDVLKEEGYDTDKSMMMLHVVNSSKPLPNERAVAKL